MLGVEDTYLYIISDYIYELFIKCTNDFGLLIVNSLKTEAIILDQTCHCLVFCPLGVLFIGS